MLVGATPVAAGTPVPLTLDDALDRAERDNPELGALREHQAALEQRAAAASRASWPRLSVSVDAFRTDDPARVFAAKLERGALGVDDLAIQRLNDPAAISHLSSSLRADLPIDVFGAVRAASRASAAEARAGSAAISEAVQDLRARVVEAYRRAVLAEAATEVTAHALDGARAREAELQARVEAGGALTADLLRARTRRRQREADLAQREDDRAAALAVLDRLMGADGTQSFAPTEAATAPAPLAGDLATWTGKALASRAQARGAADRAEAAGGGTARRAARRRPHARRVRLVQTIADRSGPGRRAVVHGGAAVRWTPFPTRSRRVAAAGGRAAGGRRARCGRPGTRCGWRWRWPGGARARRARAVHGGRRRGRGGARGLRVVQERRQAGLATLTDELETESATLAAELEERAASTEVGLADAALRRAAGNL
jgi:outer membrane protein TolC